MHIGTTRRKQNGKVYTSYWLRTSYREDKKVKHKSIANLSSCSEAEIAAMKLALKHKDKLSVLTTFNKDSVVIKQGPSVGVTCLLLSLAKRLHISDALGSTAAGKLALWQVFARIINQGSRLSAVRLADSHAACDILNLDGFNEDDLYSNLDWIAENQCKIEDKLFKKRKAKTSTEFFLYDVTSSYFEGEHNDLAQYGYNRDKKKGKKQIVIGLLCDEDGVPITVEVFEGNTQDPATLKNQIQKTAERFKCKGVTFVGDKGMIKASEIKDLGASDFHFITTITKPQINKLIEDDTLQLGLFSNELAEIIHEDLRYIFRRNATRQEEMKASREAKFVYLAEQVEKKNLYLQEHPKAKMPLAVERIQERVSRLKAFSWITVCEEGRTITLVKDEEALIEESKLDGCYVMKTDLPKDISKETINARYKDLALVESAFRTFKTAHLQLRPIYLRRAARTKAHVFVVMLSYMIVQELEKYWMSLDTTVAEGIEQLSTLCSNLVKIGNTEFNNISEPRNSIKQLLELAQVTMPVMILSKGIVVATRKKLAKN